MAFKLLALRVLEGCSTEVIKNLKENETYLFDNGYKYDENENYLVINNDVSGLPQDFYYKKNKKGSKLEYVNFQAIVGENGSGKSSLIELLLRILNNFFKQYRLNKTTDRLYFSKGVLAELYYLKGNSICKIFVDSRELKTKNYNDSKENDQEYIQIEFYENNKPKQIVNNLKNNKTLQKAVRKDELIDLKQLFYSMYVNYSIYGIDPRDFAKEDLIPNGQEKELKDYQDNIPYESWLDLIFHKNDGYQTPIVIHPYRDEGIINVRNEKRLLNQRMVSLLLTEENYKELSENISFYSLEISSIKKNIIEHLVKTILDKNIADIIIPLHKKDTLESWLKHKTKSTDIRQNEESVFFNQIHNRCIKLNERFKVINNKSRNYEHIFEEIVDSFYNLLGKVEDTKDKEKIIVDYFKENGKEEEFNFIKYFFKSLNINQFQNILLLDFYYEFWLKKLEINSFEELSPFEQNLFEYIVVKSFKNIRYPKYDNFNRRMSYNKLIYNNYSLDRTVSDSHETYLNRLINDTSHISFKLKQCISFIKQNEDLNRIKSIYEELYKRNVKSGYTVEIDKIRGEIKNYKGELELLYLSLPPIFETDIIVENENKVKESISKISSGEFQFISNISSIIYHLKNLDSVNLRKPDKNGFNEQYIYNYSNINIILDEIELYFHPEFQRRFVSEIINKLQDISFKQIESISFILLTHSPFVLSDIPSQNVLKLKEGVPVSHNLINSFGANIHDLLADEFFLKNGFMGEFAKSKIQEIITILNRMLILRNFKNIINDILNETDLDNDIISVFRGALIEIYESKSFSVNEIKDAFLKFCKYRLSREQLNDLKAVSYEKELIEEQLDFNESRYLDNYFAILNDINCIGEPIIRLQLLNMYEKVFDSNKDKQEVILDKITRLEEELEKLKKEDHNV